MDGSPRLLEEMGKPANEMQRWLIYQGEARKEKYYLLVVQNLREH